jgi:hypothetical protein
MKNFIFLALLGTGGIAQAQTQPAPGTPMARPHNVQAQAAANPNAAKIRACLEKQLGKPGEGAPPTKEKMMAAMNTCHVKMPPTGAVRDQNTTAPTPPPPKKAH